MGRRASDVSNQKFGRLAVVQRVSSSKAHAQWLCKCDCGKEIIVSGAHLKSGFIRSCGCLLTDILVKRNTMHGLSGTLAYEIWCRSKKSARERRLQFNIEPKDIQIPEFCPVLGIRIKQSLRKGPSDSSPSIDRIFPERGYVKGNIRMISQRANRIKNDATTEELEKILDDSRHFEVFAYA
jgi:hypothetical protein